jgi:polyphosphate kinase 2
MKDKRKANTDRRKTDKDRGEESKDGRVQIWVKEEMLLYEEELKKLQIELLKFQNHVKENGLKVIMIFEGRDAAGKGGTIKRIIEHLNPRGARVVALSKPSDQEMTQWYFQRYAAHLPSAGEIVFFDRSWYNRAMVEPVMGFCTQRQQSKFLKDAPLFEKMLAEEDIKIFKFYFSVTKEEQAKRFAKREQDPLKQYKLSDVDLKAQEMWDAYALAKYMMLSATHTEIAPWTVVKSDSKKKARINTIKHILNFVEYPNKIDASEIEVDKDVIIFGRDEAIAMESRFKFSSKGE